MLHVRDGPTMQLVELPEQSCHAFLTFGNVESPLPSLKVGLNSAFTKVGAFMMLGTSSGGPISCGFTHETAFRGSLRISFSRAAMYC